MSLNIHNYVMPPRPDWNAIGPRLPIWFIKQLNQLDPQLVTQFMPPAPILGSKLNSQLFPYGAWAICRRMRRTGWLHRRWAWSLCGPNGEPLTPTPETIRVLRISRNLWKQGRADVMDDSFDHAIRSAESAKSDESRERAMVEIERLCRMHDFARWRTGRISTYVRS